MKVFIRPLFGDTTLLQVNEYFTISELKALVHKDAHSVDYRIHFAGKALRDQSTLTENDICEGCFMEAIPLLQGGIKFFVAFESDKTNKAEINVTETTTIGEVKRIVEGKLKIPPECQMLQYGSQTLDDSRTVFSYEFMDSTQITLLIRDNPEISIFVITPKEKKLALIVNPNMTLSEFKNILQEKLGIAPKQQTLYHSGKLMTKDSQTLLSYEIERDDEIHMCQKVKGGL